MRIPFTPDLVLYHGNCPDGWCAAYLAQRCWPGIELRPMTYGDPVPYSLVENRKVVVVDFSWKRDDVRQLQILTNHDLVVLDHHKSAQAELVGMYRCYFDMNRSGASMAWDAFGLMDTWDQHHPDCLSMTGQCYACDCGGPRRHWVVDYVEDRDLWRLKLPHSREVNAYIMALPQTIEAWDGLVGLGVDEAARRGQAILLHIDQYLAQLGRQVQSGTWAVKATVNYEQVTVGVVNAPYMNISDLLGKVVEAHDVGLGWFERADGRVQFSLRSKGPHGPDVSNWAIEHGGGGHKHAAGFEMSVPDARVFLDSVLNR